MYLREYRKAKRLSQEALGQYIGMAKQTISHFETGVRVPTVDTKYWLAEAFGITIFDLDRPPSLVLS